MLSEIQPSFLGDIREVPVETLGSLAGSGEQTPEQVASATVLRKLAFAPRTRAELSSTLVEQGIPDQVVVSVLDRFAELGLIDDQAFAFLWVTSRHRVKGRARRVLAHELRSKGVSAQEAEIALNSITTEDEWERARLLVDRRLIAVLGLSTQAKGRRLIGYLARRGYPTHMAVSVVREVLSSTDHDTP